MPIPHKSCCGVCLLLWFSLFECYENNNITVYICVCVCSSYVLGTEAREKEREKVDVNWKNYKKDFICLHTNARDTSTHAQVGKFYTDSTAWFQFLFFSTFRHLHDLFFRCAMCSEYSGESVRHYYHTLLKKVSKRDDKRRKLIQRNRIWTEIAAKNTVVCGKHKN